jgi:hypothetical protein
MEISACQPFSFQRFWLSAFQCFSVSAFRFSVFSIFGQCLLALVVESVSECQLFRFFARDLRP